MVKSSWASVPTRTFITRFIHDILVHQHFKGSNFVFKMLGEGLAFYTTEYIAFDYPDTKVFFCEDLRRLLLVRYSF